MERCYLPADFVPNDESVRTERIQVDFNQRGADSERF